MGVVVLVLKIAKLTPLGQALMIAEAEQWTLVKDLLDPRQDRGRDELEVLMIQVGSAGDKLEESRSKDVKVFYPASSAQAIIVSWPRGRGRTVVASRHQWWYSRSRLSGNVT